MNHGQLGVVVAKTVEYLPQKLTIVKMATLVAMPIFTYGGNHPIPLNTSNDTNDVMFIFQVFTQFYLRLKGAGKKWKGQAQSFKKGLFYKLKGNYFVNA